MRKFATIIFILCLVLTDRAAFATRSVEVEEYENLPLSHPAFTAKK